MSDVFISYSRRDGEFVRRLGDALADAGLDVWVDWEDIPPTADWLARIHEGIDASDAFVFVLSPESAGSGVCSRELQRAVDGGKRIIPLLLHVVPDADVPAAVGSLNWIDVSDPARFDEQLAVLLAAMQTDLEWVQQHTRRLTQATEWDARGRDRSLLLRGRELDAAESWLRTGTTKEPHPTALQIEFLQASRRSAGRRQRTLLGGVSVGLVVALVLAVLAVLSRNDARHQRSAAQEQAKLATSRELSASAALVKDEDPELSLMLASRAIGIRPTDQAVSATRSALLASQVRATIDSGPVMGADISADHRWVFTIDEEGAGRTWHAADGSPAAELPDLAMNSDGGLGNVVRVQGAFSPSSDRIAAISRGRGAALFDPATGRAVVALRHPDDGDAGARTVSWGDDGDSVAVGWDDGTVTVHASADGRVRRHVRVGDHAVYSVALSDDGRTLAASTLGDDQVDAGVWDVSSGRQRSRLDIPAGTNLGLEVLLAAGGERVFTNGRSSAAELWDSATGEAVATVSESSSGAVAVSVGGGDWVAAADYTGPVHVVDATTGEPISTFAGHDNANANANAVESMTFTPSGRIISAGTDGQVLVWVPGTGDIVGSLRGLASQVRKLAASDDGAAVVTASTDGTRVWNPGEILSINDVAGDAGAITPDGRTLLVSGDDGLTVRDAATGKLRRRLLESTDDLLGPVELSEDGRVAYAGTSSGLDAWDLASGRRLTRLTAPGRDPATWRASGDGRVLAGSFYRTGGEGPDVVTVETRGRAPVQIRTGDVDDLELSRDGRLLLVAGLGRARLYDARTGRLLHRLSTQPTTSGSTTATISRDGKLVALSSDDLVSVFRSDDGSRVGTRHRAAGQVVEDLAFSPDGRLLAAGAFAGTDVWDMETGKATLRLSSNDRVQRVRWSPDSQFLITDDTVRVRIYLASGERTQPPLIFLPGTRASLTSDGLRIVVADLNPGGTPLVRVWPCDVCRSPSALVRLAKQRITREFRPNERRRYLHE